jgi:hypothetical protein
MPSEEIVELRFSEPDKFLQCPQCDNDCVHIIKAIVKNTEAPLIGKFSSEKVQVYLDNMKGGNDYSVILEYECEEGHRGRIRINHHEGNIWVYHEPYEILKSMHTRSAAICKSTNLK